VGAAFTAAHVDRAGTFCLGDGCTDVVSAYAEALQLPARGGQEAVFLAFMARPFTHQKEDEARGVVAKRVLSGAFHQGLRYWDPWRFRSPVRGGAILLVFHVTPALRIEHVQPVAVGGQGDVNLDGYAAAGEAARQ
jgi:hypothetical protein